MNNSTPVKIEKNVPIPERNNLPDLPLQDMEIGDSFMIEMETDNNSRAVQTLRQRVSRFQTQNPNLRFRVMRDVTEKGMRVFRVA